jgi:TIR domain/Protein of unknown function (DUF2628)
MSGHVFISHGSEDREEANALSAFLEGRGVTAWIAPRDVRPGMDYSEALQAAIESCLAFVVIVTETSNKSPYVRAETEMAFSGHKPIFPVRHSDIKPAAGLAFFLKIRHWTDAYGPGRETSLERLARELETLSGIAPAPAAAAAPAQHELGAPPPAPAPRPPANQELLAAAIGPNADYFLRHWAAMDSKGRSYDWNWAACFLNFCWFAYRKMWLPAVGIGFVYVVTTPLLDPTNQMLFRVTAFFVVGLSFVTGGYGNKLYRTQIERLVAGTAGMAREEAVQHLRRRGGTSVPGLIGSIVAILLLGALAGLVLALPRIAAANPAGAPPAPAQESAAAAPTELAARPVLDQNYLIGRWSDDGDCSRASEFTADGRFIALDGGTGIWNLDGDELTASGPNGAVTMRVTPLDQNRMSLTTAGQTGTSTRC